MGYLLLPLHLWEEGRDRRDVERKEGMEVKTTDQKYIVYELMDWQLILHRAFMTGAMQPRPLKLHSCVSLQLFCALVTP